MTSRDTSHPAPAGTAHTRYHCPACNAPLPWGAQRCPACGEEAPIYNRRRFWPLFWAITLGTLAFSAWALLR